MSVRKVEYRVDVGVTKIDTDGTEEVIHALPEKARNVAPERKERPHGPSVRPDR